MKGKLLTVVLAVCCMASANLSAKSVEVEGEVSNVIVYRGQALVTRTIKVDLPKGTSELVVTKLPSQIISESLYSQSSDNITVVNVRYLEKVTRADSYDEVKKLDAQIEDVQKKLRLTNGDKARNTAQLKRIEQLMSFAVDAQRVDVNRGVLQYEQLIETTTYIEGKITEYNTKMVEIDERVIQVEKELKKLQEKRKRVASGHSTTERQAVLSVHKADDKAGTIELNYLVKGANWTPQYNLRARPDKQAVTIEYNAVLQQSTGESWNNVTLSLSTAQPSLVASAPYLKPMEISLAGGAGPTRVNQPGQAGAQTMNMQMTQEQQGALRSQSEEFEDLIRQRRTQAKKGKGANLTLNTLAIRNQILELNADKERQKMMQIQAVRIERTEGVSVMYTIAGKLTLPSRSDQQLLTVANIKAKAGFALLATPLLTDYVYLQGEITNNSDIILLPGPASMYRNGQFVGKDNINLVTSGQEFTVGFGIDSHIQVVRHFEDKKVDTLWGNRVDTHEYRIEINNYKSKPIVLRLIERLPYTESTDIEIATTKMSHKLSTDKKYLEKESKKGILRWDVKLPANSTGEKKTTLEYGFTLKYDNDMHIRHIKG